MAVMYDYVLDELRLKDVVLVSLASGSVLPDPLIVNNLQVTANASINNLHLNNAYVSTATIGNLTTNNISNHSTVSTNYLYANGVSASLASIGFGTFDKVVSATATLGLTHISTIDWNLTSGATVNVEGQMNWDANQQTAVIGMAGGNVDLALGMETLFPRRVRNSTGSTMAKGTVVYINGVSGNTPTIERAIATSDMSSAFTLGMTAEDIANTATGWVTTFGELTGINLSAYTGGDTLYLSGATAGAFTNVPQSAPNHYVRVGTVVKATTDGALVVNVINGYELNELHNVAITSLASGQILQSGVSSLWYNRSLASAVADLNVLASLGSLAYLNSVTQEYLPSSASFSNLYVTDIQTGGLAVTSTASVRNLRATNILGGNASLSGALNVGNIFGLNFLAVASTLIAETGIITNVLSTDISNTSNISTNTLYANIISAGTYLNLPSLGSLAVLNQLSYGSLLNLPSLGSLAVLNELSHNSTTSIQGGTAGEYYHLTNAQLTNLNNQSGTNTGNITISDTTSVNLTLGGVNGQLLSADVLPAGVDHNSLAGLTLGDAHTQYALLAGRSGGQTLHGGNVANTLLILRGTSANGNTATNNAIRMGVGNGGGTYAWDLKHNGTVVQTANVTSGNGYSLGQTITGTSGDSIGAFFDITDTAGGNKTIFGHRAKLTYSGATIIQGMQSTSNQMFVSGGGVVNYAEVLTSNLDVTGNSAIGEARLIRLFAPNVASTASIGTLIGLDIPAITQGGTNYSIFSSGGKMYHAGYIGIGTTSPSTKLEIDDTDPTYNRITIEHSAAYTSGYVGYQWQVDGAYAGGLYRNSSTNDVNIWTQGSGAAARFNVANNGRIGIGMGVTAPAAQTHIDQASTTAAIPVLTLDQADLSEEFINFVSTIGATNPIVASSTATTFSHKVRVAVNGTFKWLYLYNA